MRQGISRGSGWKVLLLGLLAATAAVAIAQAGYNQLPQTAPRVRPPLCPPRLRRSFRPRRTQPLIRRRFPLGWPDATSKTWLSCGSRFLSWPGAAFRRRMLLSQQASLARVDSQRGRGAGQRNWDPDGCRCRVTPGWRKHLLSALGSPAASCLRGSHQGPAVQLWPRVKCSGCPSCDSPGPSGSTCAPRCRHRLRPNPSPAAALAPHGPSSDGRTPADRATAFGRGQARLAGGVLQRRRWSA